MWDFSRYYGRHKQFRNVVAQKVVRQKLSELHIRIGNELERDLTELAKELNQDKSKVARDILTDFFLERHSKEWAQEIKEWK